MTIEPESKKPGSARAGLLLPIGWNQAAAARPQQEPTYLFHLEMFSRALAAIFDNLVLNMLAFVEGAQPGPLDRGDVHEHILAAALRLDKAITFCRVEPLHSACSHYRSPRLRCMPTRERPPDVPAAVRIPSPERALPPARCHNSPIGLKSTHDPSRSINQSVAQRRKSPGARDQPVSAAAPAQPGCMVAVGAGRAGGGAATRQTHSAVGGLRGLPLVPRDGARKLRGRRHRRRHERPVREHQSRSRGAAGHRPDLHVGAASSGRAGRLAADDVSDAEGRAGMGRDVFPEDVAVRPPGICRRAARSFAAVSRGTAQNRSESRRADGAAGEPGAAGRKGRGRRQRARPACDADRRRLRPAARRLARRAEISQRGAV